MQLLSRSPHFFFFNDTATTEIYTLSLHDALPICGDERRAGRRRAARRVHAVPAGARGGAHRAAARRPAAHAGRSEEHTSELQSRQYLVCRLLLEKKKRDALRTDGRRTLRSTSPDE